MEDDEESAQVATNSQQQQSTSHHVEDKTVAETPALGEGGDKNEEAVKSSVDIPAHHRPVPFTSSIDANNEEIITIEQKMSSLNVGGDNDEKVGESSPAVDVTPAEAEQSSPSKNALLTFGIDGEETIENPVSLMIC